MTVSDHAEYSAQTQFKENTTKIVLPLLGICSILFWSTYYGGLNHNSFYGIVLAILGGIANGWISSRDRIFRVFGYSIRTRSNGADFSRWVLNLALLDPAIFILIRPDATGHLCTWVIVFLGSVADTFDRRHRYWTSAVGVVAFVATFVFLHGSQFSPLQILYFTCGMVALLWISHSIYHFWSKSLLTIEVAQKKEGEMSRAIISLRAEAMIGQQSRAIAHEIKNIVMVMDLCLNSDQPQREAIFRRSVEKLRRLSMAVGTTAKSNYDVKKVQVPQLIEDVKLILPPFVNSHRADLEIAVDDAVNQALIEEFEGSTYLIIHNLIKNSLEAFDEAATDRRRVFLKVESVHESESGKVSVRFSVEDNGCGMDSNELSEFLSGRLQTSKNYGQGLGGKFIVEQCAANKFKLGGQSSARGGTRIWFEAPAQLVVK